MVHYAIVGFGNAGYHAARAIRARDPQGEIHILSDQTFPPANPMLTTYYVKGALDWPGLFPYGSLEELSRSMKLHLHMGRPVRRVHPVQRELELDGGERFEYGQCLICTGASAFLPPAEGMGLANVCCVRTPQDACRLKDALETQRLRSILVVGASMVGIKVVELADQYGIACTLADGAPHLFALAAFRDTAERIELFLKSRGISLAFSAMLDKIVQSPKAPSGALTAIMKDGRQLPADLIVVCIGARANMELVRGTPVATGRGILVDRGMRTNVPGLYAAGDCCEGYELQSKEQRNIGLWANAGYQGRTAGANMAGADESFDYTILHNISHFMGIDFLGMGDIVHPQPGDRYRRWQRGTLYIQAMEGADGTLKGLNLLGGAAVSGIVKNHFMKRLSGENVQLDALSRCQLKNAGFPQNFIDYLGGMVYDGA